MLRNYFKIAIRSLIRDNVYTVTNVGGLAIGIATFVLLMLWVQDELGYDRFHTKGDRIYRTNASFNNDGNITTWPTSPGPVAYFARKEVPAVELAARVANDNGMVLFTAEDKDFTENNALAYVESNFFQVFDFRLLRGNKDKPFPNSKSVILTEKMAHKFFGDEDPIGKVIRVEKKKEYVVVGVVADFPSNSTLNYGIMLPFDILIEEYQANEYWKSLESDWGNYNYYTYLLLRPDAKPDAVAAQLSDIHHSHQDESAKLQYKLQPLSELHLYNADGTEEGIQTVRIFLVVAIAILAIACINYVNVATARATRRALEVGVRKSVGANRGRLITQFLVEASLMAVIALLIAIVFIQVTMPLYNELSGKEITFNLTGSSMGWLLAALVITWLAAGIYPALVLSSYQPLQVMRGRNLTSTGSPMFRKVLVTTQFAASIAIIVGTVVVSRQLSFMRNKKLGFSTDNVFTFALRGDMFKNKQTIINDLKQHPGVEAVTMGGQYVYSIGSTTGDTGWEGQLPGQSLLIHPINVDHDFMQIMKMEMAEGRMFHDSKADTASYILNEAAVRQIGLQNPIGKSFSLWGMKGSIVGVVKDFHHSSLKQQIEPSILFYRPEWLWIVYVRTNGADNAGAIAAGEQIWMKYNPEYPFEYSFIDSAFDRMYKSEQRVEQLFSIFAFIAILVSCLGLFGLATFTATQRVKEIGVRKVMGATSGQIVVLLSGELMKLVLVALVIAIPLSYFGMQNWLSDFAYRIDVDWTIFTIAGGLSLFIAFLTVSTQTLRAAVRNPVDSLKTE
ncbi:MAG: ABC transporter permease [Cyclobacteriaceae bacterium]|nr:ABC transporter permease [Cyclobacteriaceae bacterium]